MHGNSFRSCNIKYACHYRPGSAALIVGSSRRSGIGPEGRILPADRGGARTDGRSLRSYTLAGVNDAEPTLLRGVRQGWEKSLVRVVRSYWKTLLGVKPRPAAERDVRKRK